MFRPASPDSPLDNTALVTTWWGETLGLRCGRIFGRNAGGPWKSRHSSRDCVWLWLNGEGEGLIWGETDRFFLKPGMYALTGGDQSGDWACMRSPGEHVLDLVVISRDWLRRRLGGHHDWLQPGLAHWLEKGGPVAFCGLMGVWERDLSEALAKAVSEPGPSRLLAEARVLEWSATRLFRQNHHGVMDHNAGERDPVKRAIQVLRANLDQPLDLNRIAREVGVSPHHLSRKVGAQTGATLQRHLRRLRVERACEALDSGRMNVTEVALEVGYQSLSHFAKAFREETGSTPSEWLAKRARGN